MKPGEHLVIVGSEEDALAARSRGLQLRDTLLMLLPHGLCLTAFLFRQPLEGTVVENVLKHGVGGLWIDGCRISGHVPACTGQGFKTGKFAGNAGIGDTTLDGQPWKNTGGRWPSNLVLVHGQGCVRVGDKRVKGSHDTTGVWGSGFSGVCYGTYRGKQGHEQGYTSSDGLETVPAYDCVSGCPVRVLDEMSGDLGVSSGGGMRRDGQNNVAFGKHSGHPQVQNVGHGDAGGASRFYPKFGSLAEALDWLARLVGGPPCPGG